MSGIELNTLGDSLWNLWRSLGQSEPLGLSGSYEDSEKEFKEKKRIYWSLMERYAKTNRLKPSDRWSDKLRAILSRFPQVLNETSVDLSEESLS